MTSKTRIAVFAIMVAAFLFNCAVEPDDKFYYRDAEMGPDNDGY